MKVIILVSLFLLTASIFIQVNPVFSQYEENHDKTLSPYFLIKNDNPESDQLPLRSTDARVNISGVIADVIVTQVYKNEGLSPLEAIYIFPASTRAAVYAMKMTVGERTILATIKTREEAGRVYEQAKQQGKSASLLVQQRPNVFQMHVANILPGDLIKVELKYTELLVPVNKTYEFVYPTVVGPRYSEKREDSMPDSENWVRNPYLHQGEAPANNFNLDLHLSAGMPIKEITSPSHRVNTRYTGPSQAAVELDESEMNGGNRDFILRYRLAGNKIQTGMLLYEGAEENFFLLMVQPPKKIKKEFIPPREYVFIMDVSGSMHGFPLEISKRLLKDLIGNLRPTDRFNVLLFAGGASVMSEQSLAATPENIQRAVNLIERQRGGGGTRLLPALKKALDLPGKEGFSRSIIVATDGYVDVEEEVFELIRNNLNRANMFTFGIGSSVNRFLIEGMSRVGMGEPFIITRPEEAMGRAATFRELIQSPVLTEIQINYARFKAYEIEPLSIPDVMAERPVIVFGKYRGAPVGKIRINGISGKEPYHQEIDLSEIRPDKQNKTLRYLWARHRIALLSDYNRLRMNDERVNEITSLGLTYNLMTAYTSFVAIDNQVRNADGRLTTVKQPLPLPQGVSDYALGGRMLKQTRSRSLDMPQPGKVKGQKMAEFRPTETEAFADAEEKEKAQKIKRPVLELKKVIVKGNLSTESIKKSLVQNLHRLQSCLGKSLQTQGEIRELEIKITIGSDGKISRLKVVKPELNNKLSFCLLSRLNGVLFTKPAEGKPLEVTLIFTLK